jgi:hypothetical protein
MAWDADKNRIYLQRYIRTDTGRYVALRRAAKDKGLGFDISPEDHALILRTDDCFYCHGPLPPTGHGLDRIDNSKGYLVGNVVPSCIACNRIRNRYLTHEEMAVAMKAVIEYREHNENGAGVLQDFS